MTNTARSVLKTHFPRYSSDPSSIAITSPVDMRYNCAGWAVGIDLWLEPLPNPFGYWPIQSEGTSLDAYQRMFEHYRFSICADGTGEATFEKIVIYGDDQNNFTHVARLLREGGWTSKLGRGSDITHRKPETLEGKAYGKVRRYMKRSEP